MALEIDDADTEGLIWTRIALTDEAVASLDVPAP